MPIILSYRGSNGRIRARGEQCDSYQKAARIKRYAFGLPRRSLGVGGRIATTRRRDGTTKDT
jgi:hypothetical protein